MSKLCRIDNVNILKCECCGEVYSCDDIVVVNTMNSHTGVIYKCVCNNCKVVSKCYLYDKVGLVIDEFTTSITDITMNKNNYNNGFLGVNDDFIDKYIYEKYNLKIDLGFPIIGYKDKYGRQLYSNHIVNFDDSNNYQYVDVNIFNNEVSIGLSNHHCGHCPFEKSDYVIIGLQVNVEYDIKYKEVNNV